VPSRCARDPTDSIESLPLCARFAESEASQALACTPSLCDRAIATIEQRIATTDAARTSDRGARGCRNDEPRDSGCALPQREDRRVEPVQRLPEALRALGYRTCGEACSNHRHQVQSQRGGGRKRHRLGDSLFARVGAWFGERSRCAGPQLFLVDAVQTRNPQHSVPGYSMRVAFTQLWFMVVRPPSFSGGRLVGPP
jgi:hypothetical protein